MTKPLLKTDATKWICAALAMTCVAEAQAEPVCSFSLAGHRLVSPFNASDWSCMRERASLGEAYWQFYVGLQLVNGFSPNGGGRNTYAVQRRGDPDGVRLLQAAARSADPTVAANAMNQLARIYLSTEFGLRDDELSYQWSYLASQQPLFRDQYKMDETLLHRLTPERQHALRLQAEALLRPRQEP